VTRLGIGVLVGVVVSLNARNRIRAADAAE
jgi:hypothetical protein